jgi:hypothetical protein
LIITKRRRYALPGGGVGIPFESLALTFAPHIALYQITGGPYLNASAEILIGGSYRTETEIRFRRAYSHEKLNEHSRVVITL